MSPHLHVLFFQRTVAPKIIVIIFKNINIFITFIFHVYFIDFIFAFLINAQVEFELTIITI